MTLLKPNPLRFSLEKTEIASRPRAPLIVFRQTQPSVFQNASYICFGNARFLKRVHRLDIGLSRDITVAILVPSNGYVAEHWIITDILFEGLQFQHSRAPAHSRRRQITAVHFEPMIEPPL